MVFQEQGIFPWMSVLRNTALGLKVRGIGKVEREEEARADLRLRKYSPCANVKRRTFPVPKHKR